MELVSSEEDGNRPFHLISFSSGKRRFYFFALARSNTRCNPDRSRLHHKDSMQGPGTAIPTKNYLILSKSSAVCTNRRMNDLGETAPYHDHRRAQHRSCRTWQRRTVLGLCVHGSRSDRCLDRFRVEIIRRFSGLQALALPRHRKWLTKSRCRYVTGLSLHPQARFPSLAG